MDRRIKISTKATGTVEAALSNENPQTAERIWEALPIEGRANRWGDEIYFSIPVSVEEEHSRAEVEIGAIAYWPPGSALCIFFGRTPASKDDKPRAASPVNVFAKVNADTSIFRKVSDGDKVTIEKS
ncbi:MAG: cyclophilin-like fold protein [Candidatus Bathyarchaeia archaeon]